MDIVTVGALTFAFVIVCLIIQGIETSHKQGQVGKVVANLPDFVKTNEYIGADGDSGIAIDEVQSKVCLIRRARGCLLHREISYKDILSSELFEDGQTITKTARGSQAAGAAIGGLLFGGIGAVVGGLSGTQVQNSKVNRIELRLVVNDSLDPIHNICFFDGVANRDSARYKIASEMARQWQVRLDVLIKRADDEMRALEQPLVPSTPISIADELEKLAGLKSQGILTNEEFLMQKEKLLSASLLEK